MHERGRLLQRLQQAVGRLVVQGVHALEHEHPARGLERRAPGGVDHGLGHVGAAHHVRAGGAHPGQVGVGARVDPVANAVGVGRALGQQLGRERPRRLALAHARGPVEEVRVRGAGLERGHQAHARVRMVLGAGQHERHPPGLPHRGQHVRVHRLGVAGGVHAHEPARLGVGQRARRPRPPRAGARRPRARTGRPPPRAPRRRRCRSPAARSRRAPGRRPPAR